MKFLDEYEKFATNYFAMAVLLTGIAIGVVLTALALATVWLFSFCVD